MLSIPTIKTALPKHRYQIGTFSAAILAEIESDDPVRYRYICAVVEDGGRDPLLYISLITGGEGDRVVVASADHSQELLAPPAIRDLENFTEQAIAMVQKLLQLTDEMPAQLM